MRKSQHTGSRIAAKLRSLVESGDPLPPAPQPAPLRAKTAAVADSRRQRRRNAEDIAASEPPLEQKLLSSASIKALEPREAAPLISAEHMRRSVGDAKLIEALEYSGDPAASKLSAVLRREGAHLQPFIALCKAADIAPKDVFRLFTDYEVARGIVGMVAHVPRIMEDVALDSKSKRMPCGVCSGTAVVRQPDGRDVLCMTCDGNGFLTIPGDKDARQLTFETLGVKKGGGISINMQQNQQTFVGGVPLASAMPSMAQFTADLDEKRFINVTPTSAASKEMPVGGVEPPAGPSTGPDDAVEED